ncbi:lipopolysaccharide biosynthesis protein [Nocardioides sp. C4-1]|uniref:lipopolysaccharide biosynthesis protein n=1 Tax=Nocardioides sp. C4-1 TaxID=3151851 RepID=UPI0032650EBA
MSEQHAATDQLRHVARGASLGLAGSAFAAASGFGLAVVVTRGLNADDAGRFFAVTSALALLVAASSFGTEAGLARFLQRLAATGDHRDVDRALAWAVAPTLTVATVLGAALAWQAGTVAGWLGLGDAGVPALRWLALALPAAVAADVLLASTRGFGRIGPTVVVDRVVRSGVQVAVPLVVLALGGGLLGVVVGWAAAYAVSASLALLVVARSLATRSPGRGTPTPGTGGRGVGARFWSFTAPRGVGSLAQMGIQKSDIVLVAVLLRPVDAALYAAATRFVPVGQMAVQALQQVLQPRFTTILLTDDHRTLAEVFRVTTAWSVLLAWPLYLVVAAAPASYLALFGDGYDDAVPVVVVMCAAMLVAVATGPVDTLLLMAGRSGLSMANALAALALDLGLCLLLVPRWGITGAACAWAVAVVTRCLLATWQVRAELGVAPGRYLARVALLPLACFVPVLALGTRSPGPTLLVWLLSGLVATLAYLACLVGLVGRRDDLHLDLVLPRRRPAPTPTTTATTCSTPTTPDQPEPPEESDPACGLATSYAPSATT